MIDILFGSKPMLWVVLLLTFCALAIMVWLLEAFNDWLDHRRLRRLTRNVARELAQLHDENRQRLHTVPFRNGGRS